MIVLYNEYYTPSFRKNSKVNGNRERRRNKQEMIISFILKMKERKKMC